jgi:hypothetical protein
MEAGMGRSLMVAACVAAALAGCRNVPEKPLAADAADSLAGREIRLSSGKTPEFAARTAGKTILGGLFGALGGAIAGSSMAKAGNEIIERNKVPDPAGQIGAELGTALAARFKAKAPAAGAADLVLDVQTLQWGFTYLPGEPDKYRVQYQAKARLLDAKNGSVLAESHCAAPRAPHEAAVAPTYRDLVANDAARLKSELAQAADFCAGQFALKMFSFDIAEYRPASVATPKAEPTARAAITAVEPGKALPAPGTVWNYRYHDRKFSKREREFSVQLAVTAGTSVTETFSSGGEQQTYSSNAREMNFAVRRVDTEPIYELAPYLLAHVPAPSADPAQRPRYPADGAASSWKVRITEVERARVQVPAGEFEAVRLRITGENPALLHGVTTAHPLVQAASDYRTQRFEYTVWYVPEIGRYVQSRHQTFSRLGNMIGDHWVQLASVERPEPRR